MMMVMIMFMAMKTLQIFFLIFLTTESAFGIIDYCRNHTFDRPTSSESLHFSKENSDREFGIYDKFKSLHCCCHGYRSIEWFKDGKPCPWPTDVSTLIIHPESGNQTIYTQQLTPVDSGKYWCIARNETHVIKHELFLVVSGPSISMDWPKTTYKPRDQVAVEGESVRFYCEAFVGTIDLPDFESDISWERFDHNRSFVDGVRIVQENVFREEKRILGSYLTFKEVEKDDYGEYRCNVRNLGDQVVQLSVWLNPKPVEESPSSSDKEENFKVRGSLVVVILLVLTAVMSTITFLHLGSYLKIRRGRIAEAYADKKDMLVVYHQNDAKEAVKAAAYTMRNRYRNSCCLYSLQYHSQIGEDDLKAKAHSYRAVLALMTPSLVGGDWTSKSIHFTVQALLKVHFTVICVFTQSLPSTNPEDDQILKDSLSKVHVVDRSKRSWKFWNCSNFNFFSFKRKDVISIGSSQELI